ncbi:hypothetical protein [Streptomyces sp. TLI_105]|uniref:hypothetical protein n=1 Tax=Streptomyces sp. TLI_105 TaxID=1881019 RepID=UPI00089BA372|nr:hypothetical protein [Streptomyces sp. TLI_105]SEB57326.1 hypothetical protein SAMN05428939_0031 [Streptomyces sp. TLI_105]SEE26432.1 hypothetical protein SAMN05428939_7929 [Streptomyces sp. TLI_105]
MATSALVCFIAVCDLCGYTSNDTEYGLHADSPEEAIRNVTEGFDERDGWTLTPDGRLVCNIRKDAAHEDIHAAAGSAWATTP